MGKQFKPSMAIVLVLLFLTIGLSYLFYEPNSKAMAQEVYIPQPTAAPTIVPTGELTYQDPYFEISFEHDAAWSVHENIIAEDNFRGLDIYNLQFGWISIIRDENPNGLSPSDWFDLQRNDYHPTLFAEISPLTLGGDSALVLGQPATCRTAAMIVVFVDHAGYMFTFMQFETGDRTAAVELHRLLETLTFGDSREARSEIPPGLFNYPPSPADFACADDVEIPNIQDLTEGANAQICSGAEFYIPTTGEMNLPWKCFDDENYCQPYVPNPDCQPDDIFCKPHSGIDIFGGQNPGVTPVYATYDGVAQLSGDSAVRINHSAPYSGYFSYSTHMATEDGGYQDFRTVDHGELVVAGDTQIGSQGNYNTPLVHLHISYNNLATDYWPTLDPTGFLKAKDLVYYNGWNHVGNPVSCFDPLEGSAVDVFLIVDLSGSFFDDLPVFKAQAADIISSLKASNPNTRFGVGYFVDYPISPFGDPGAGDVAYKRLIDLSFDDDAIIAQIETLTTFFGSDDPESQLPALFQAATGLGQDLSGQGYPGASIPAGQQATFRAEAAKLILLWTDAGFHLPGDPGSIPYPGPGLLDTAAAVLRAGSLVIPLSPSESGLPEEISNPPGLVMGITSGGGGIDTLQSVARFTGAFAPDAGVDCDDNGVIDIPAGEPLVCEISSNGAGIGDAIVALVEAAVDLERVYLPIVGNGTNGSDFSDFFTGSSAGWSSVAGDWSVLGGSWYSTPGNSQKWSSAAHDGEYMDFDYQAAFWRSGCASCANHLIVRGNPLPLAPDNLWNTFLIFQYSANGWFSVFEVDNGAVTTLQPWVQSAAIHQGLAWNNLRVIAIGGDFYYYINETLVWVGSDTSLTSGLVGLGMYRDLSTGNQLYIDYAILTSDLSGFTDLPQDVSPLQEALNAEAWGQLATTGDIDTAPESVGD